MNLLSKYVLLGEQKDMLVFKLMTTIRYKNKVGERR
jgi:hypothetical protein